MASTMTKYLAVLVVIHTLFFFAGAEGYTDQQKGDNPHKQFTSNFRGDNATKVARVGDTSGIFDGTFRLAAKATEGFNVITGILVSPYTIWEGTGMPTMLIWLLQGVQGVIELTIIVEFLRGVSS